MRNLFDPGPARPYATASNESKQMHKHHIMPRRLGGTNDPENLVEVSIEEHAKIHHSQWILGGRWEDRVAWKMLSGQIGKEELMQEIRSENGRYTGPRNKGRKHGPHSEETKKKMRKPHPNQDTSWAQILNKDPERRRKNSEGLKRAYASGTRKSWNKGKTGVQDYSYRKVKTK